MSGLRRTLRRLVARMIAALPPGLLSDEEHFDLFERRGIHITPVHFYWPIPKVSEVPDRVFDTPSAMKGIDQRVDEQVALLESAEFSESIRAYRTFEKEGPERPEDRIGLGPFDGSMLWHLAKTLRPKRVVEIGCGTSTLVMLDALRAAGGMPDGGAYLAIEPYPRSYLKSLANSELTLVEKPVQDVPIEVFEQLGDGDILFIDSSHVAKVGSDVVYEINEILPSLRPGVMVHIHDIYLPYEYSSHWVRERKIFWNEQYVVQAFLQFNSAFEIVWSAGVARHRFPEKVAALFPDYRPAEQQSGSLWLRRKVT